MPSPFPVQGGEGTCPVCGNDSCTGMPNHTRPADYPFLPGGIDIMAQEPHVIADRRIIDDALGQVVYGPGDRVPIADAIKYGLIDPSASEKPKAKRPARAKKGPAEDRAKRPTEDR